MIRKLLLYPPLAFGRLGPSAEPCDSFHWGPNDLSPRGTGMTTIVPDESLRVAADGTVTSEVPSEIVFKDEAGFRPVSPFFELHAEWEADGTVETGPLTADVLARFGLATAEIEWTVEVANLKPFHYTLDPGDRVDATLTLRGDETEQRALLGVSPPGSARPLVPAGASVPLGAFQLTRPGDRFPELRLRFTPAIGAVYGPVDLPQRSDVYVLPADRLILNPQAAWSHFSLTGDDPRTNPGGLFAGAEESESLGLVDDVCDGLITARLAGATAAQARIAVGPPIYAPDRRPIVSIADGLKDRTGRDDLRDPAYVADEDRTALEVRDLMERALETMVNMNVDVQNDRSRQENRSLARLQGLPPEDGAAKTFPPLDPVLGRSLLLTESARQHHRRFVSSEVFDDILRENPDLLATRVREPLTPERYYDMRMPFAMRGSDRHPLHLTRRQYDLLVAWARHLRDQAERGT